MKLLGLFILGISLNASKFIEGRHQSKRLVCYYDAISTNYQGEPHFFETKSLHKALPNCTHLVYGFAQILPPTFDIQKFNFNPPPRDLKIRFPHLKVFLSVGGDKLELTEHYLQFLEAGERKQQYFAENITGFLKLNHFDGLDLAFPFPRNKPHEIRSGLETAFMQVKKIFTGDEVVDEKADAHKLQYSQFVNILRNDFFKANLQLSMTVLPNVNSSWYFDIFKIHKSFQFINLFSFDFVTPERNPHEADFSAPIYFKEGANRLHQNNVEFQVDHWINNGCPVNKLNLGIATYGRAWRLITDSGLSGVPVVESTNGAADPGKYSKILGLLSWPEICTKLDTKRLLRKVVDKEVKYGNYAFNPADRNNENGIWISFDDPDFAGIKTEYVKQKGIGGVAVYDLQNDDFHKFCRGPVFPILSRVSEGLGILHEIHKHSVNSKTFLYNNEVQPEHDNYLIFP